MLEGHSCDRFIFFFPSKYMQEDGYWLYWTNPQLFCSDGTDCCLQHGFGAPLVLLCRTCVASLCSPEEQKSGTAISPENESYSWSLHQTLQSLQVSSQLFWKLLNTRGEDRSISPPPQPCHRIALDMSLVSHLNFPLGSLSLARDLHQKLLYG